MRPLPRLTVPGLVAAFAVLLSTPGAAQRVEGDAAWARGDYAAARAAYERVLTEQPTDARANLRIGLLLSWEGRLDSSLAYLHRARDVIPEDLDARLIEARVLALRQRFPTAISRYDSVLAERPGLREAALGRAQTLAWANRLGAAEEAYRAMLERDPADRDARLGLAQAQGWRGDLPAAERTYLSILRDEPRLVRALVGLGNVYHWQAREGPAKRQADAALAVDSADAGARALRQAVRAATRSNVESSSGWSDDSDGNTNFWQAVSASTQVKEAVRAFGGVNLLAASDPVRKASRVGGEVGFSWPVGNFQFTGAAGVRQLHPDSAGDRTSATYRGIVSYRPVSQVSVGLGYARSPFDETAALIERRLDLELLDAGLDLTLRPGLTLNGGTGAAWLSDGNHRTSFLAAVSQRVRRQFTVGLLGRTLSYGQRGAGYFSPDRFSLVEPRVAYRLTRGLWEGGINGGLGAQQVGSGASAQSEWHLDARLARQWGAGNRAELFGLVTNSAVSSTTGAFRHTSLGVNLRIGL